MKIFTWLNEAFSRSKYYLIGLVISGSAAYYFMGVSQGNAIWATVIAVVMGILFLQKFHDGFFFKRAHDKVKSKGSLIYGQAQWADEKELKEQGYYSQSGFLLNDYLSFNGEGHFLTVGGTRSGKGNHLMLNLLSDSYQGSRVILDPKGELAAVTAAYQKSIGREVHILDPWELQTTIGATHGIRPCSINPLTLFNKDDKNLPDDCDLIAEMLIPFDQKKEDHWPRAARQWVSAYLLYIITEFESEKVNLNALRKMFRMNDEEFATILSEMKFVENRFSEIIQENANEFVTMWKGDNKEAKSIQSTAKTFTDIFKSEGLIQSLSTSSFDLRDITKGNTTLYICIPAERLNTHSVYLRIILGTIISVVQKYRDKPVMMIMDEFYSLGYMPNISKAMGQMPGYKLQLWPIIQDLNQLRDVYGETAWETFIANSAIRLFMGVDDNFTSEYVSKQLGNRTSYQVDVDDNISDQKAKPLLNPTEVRQFRNIIGFTKDTNPIQVEKVKYWEHPEFSKRAAKNPYVTD